MIRCLLSGVLFAASSIGLSLLFSDVSKAQSDFDNTYHTTDQLLVKHHASETAYDITDNVYEILYGNYGSGSGQLPVEFFDFYNKSSGSAVNITNNMDRRNELLELWNNDKKYWSESQRTVFSGSSNPTGVRYYVEMCAVLDYNENASAVGNFIDSGTNMSKHLKFVHNLNRFQDGTLKVEISVTQDVNGNNEKIIVNFGNPKTITDCVLSTEIQDPEFLGENSDISYKTTATNLYANLAEINYPEDYLGKEIRDTFNPIQDKTFLPEWSWSVTQDGQLTVTSQNNDNANLDADAVFDLWKDSKNWQFPSTKVVDSERQRPYHSAKFEHQLEKEEQWFTITLQHSWHLCLMEGTCEDKRPDGITHIETVIFQIYWDGKSFIAGNNANGQEDCELQEDGGIYRRVCNSLEQEPVIMRTLRGLNSNMHGLTQIVTAPLSFITSLITYNNNCTALNLPLPSAMNRDLNLPCMTPYYQQYLGFLFNLYQTILTALVCYYCFVNTLAYVKRGQNPKNDRIEVAHL